MTPRMIALFFAVYVAGLLAMTAYKTAHPDDPKPCSSFADTPREDVPARCFSDFRPEAR